MKRVHMIISGDVQGVGFRAWALRYAQGKSLTGWVKNRRDGTVEMVAEGEREILEDLVKRAHQGPDVAWVESVDVAWEEAGAGEAGEFVSFEVIY